MAHVHISDCDGKVHGDLPRGAGWSTFPPYLRAIKGLGVDDLTVSIELEYSPEPDRIVDWVREAYTSTARLMRGGARRESIAGPVGAGEVLRAVLGWPVLATVLAAGPDPATTGRRADRAMAPE